MRPIGVIGAMADEVGQLKELLGDVRTTTHIGIAFHEGTLAGRPVVLCQCGIGKVAAGACAALMIDVFDVGAVINSGVGGSLDASIDIGDLVVSTETVEYDLDVTALGYEPGHVPQLDVTYYPASRELVDHVVRAAHEVAPDIQVFEGRIASGDRFVAAHEDKDAIVEAHHALCCEMEGAAIGHVCHVAQVPYVVIRAISDKADGSAHLDYPTFERRAADVCAKVTVRMVEMA